MKRIICLLLVLFCVASFSACTDSSSKKPFENLLDHPSYDVAKERYGDKFTEKTSFGDYLLVYNYQWADCNGEWILCYSPVYDGHIIKDLELNGAVWRYTGHDLTKVRDAISEQMDADYHRNDHVVNWAGNDIYTWVDDADNNYKLVYEPNEKSDRICFYFNESLSTISAVSNN